MKPNEESNNLDAVRPHSRFRGWAALLLWVFFIWAFMFYVGPWIRDNIPIMKDLMEVAREKDIDTTTFFYSETKEFYEAERYLRETLDLAEPNGYGVDGWFILGIVFCLVLLSIGYRFLPTGGKLTIDNHDSEKDSNNSQSGNCGCPQQMKKKR